MLLQENERFFWKTAGTPSSLFFSVHWYNKHNTLANPKRRPLRLFLQVSNGRTPLRLEGPARSTLFFFC